MARLYSLLDKKVPCYHPPYHAPSDGVACRNLCDLVTDPKSQLCRYASDYDLYFVGEMSETSGVVTPATPPQLVISLVNLKITMEGVHSDQN